MMAHDPAVGAPAGGRPANQANPANARTEVVIAPVRMRDLWRVRNLQRRSFRRGLAYSVSTLILLWALPTVRFLVARHDDAILGCAIGDRSGGQSRVINLAVDPDARRCGIGELLLHALEAALPRGDMILMVQEENSGARRLYEKAGYHNVGVGRNYYGRNQNGIWMRKYRTRGGGERLYI
jgi:ribosomal-protein-alanine N-acetyltransferase